MGKSLTSAKAKEILHDKSVHGHPLTDKQRRFFGAIAGGAKPYKAESGGWLDKYVKGGELVGPKDKPVSLDGTEIFEHGEDMNTAMGIENSIGPSPLTEDGVKYSELVGEHAAKSGKTKIISSDVQRAMQTAEVAKAIGNQYLGKNKMQHYVDPTLETWNIGEYTGMPKGSFNEAEWIANPNAAPEGGESFNTFKDRMVEAYHKVKEAPKDEQVIAHSKVTRAFRALNKTGEKWTDKTTHLFLKDAEKKTKAKDGGLILKQKKNDNYDRQGNYNDYSISTPPGFVGMGNNLKGRNYSPAWGGQFQDGGNLMPAMAGANQPISMAQLGDSVKPIPMQLAMGGSMPGAVGFMYARTAGAAPANGPYAKKTKASAQNGQEMKYYQQGLDFKPKTISQDGITIDPMGYWNPDNVGEPVIIPSNVITMEDVDRKLIGISNTGDTQMMYPGEDYQFDGDYVTEYPVAKKGVSIKQANLNPIKKLDQSLNFTNYNKPTKGGWLEKYK